MTHRLVREEAALELGRGVAAMRWRVSISACLVAVLVIALGLAALRSASVYWVTAVAWLVLFWLSAAVVGAIFSEGRARVFWIGFAVFGWAGALASGVWQSELSNPRWTVNHLSSGLVILFQTHLRSSEFPLQVAICVHFLTLVFALIGGLTALVFAARSDARRQQRPTPPGTLP